MLGAEAKKWVLETEIRVVLDLVLVTLLEREKCISMKRQLAVAWGGTTRGKGGLVRCSNRA
jgi:hypothetical protein